MLVLHVAEKVYWCICSGRRYPQCHGSSRSLPSVYLAPEGLPFEIQLLPTVGNPVNLLSALSRPFTQSVSFNVISGVPYKALSTASTPSMNYCRELDWQRDKDDFTLWS